MIDNPITKSFKGLVGDILNLDTDSTFRQPHGSGGDTELVSFITDDPNHFCKECKSAICRNCGREMHKRDLDLGQNIGRKSLQSLRDEAIGSLNSSEYEEYINGRFEPLEKLPWFRKCKNSTTCEAYKHSKIEKNSSRHFRIFKSASPEAGKYIYYDNTPSDIKPYTRINDPYRLPEVCNRCGGDIKKALTVKNKHPHWGNVCNDCADVLKDSEY